MSAKIINGKEIAEEIYQYVDLLNETNNNQSIKLAIICANDDSASKIYLKSKKKACKLHGVEIIEFIFPKDTTTQKVINVIKELNQDPDINAIMVQSPMYSWLDESAIYDAIDPCKDVEGLSSKNIGKLFSNIPLDPHDIYPCTPFAVMQILEDTIPSLEKKHCVIVSRSKIVGRPLAMMLLSKNATVTVCHSKTANLKEICKQADVLITATGQAKYLTSDFVKKDAIVIDVGINKDKEGKLCGDVDFEEVSKIASAITPVPNGVGPVTTACLIWNITKCLLKQDNR